jgi:hypothetical protein
MMIGIDPNKGSPTAAAITAAEQALADCGVRASAARPRGNCRCWIAAASV